ncbi:MAG: response regulator transcription factor [Rhodothermia bacterium]|nr:response regulator transcription factor [Rhodothermia bacterium]
MDTTDIRVVVCDDADAIRSRLVGMIRRLPHVTVAGEARTARTSVDLIKNVEPDVAILDIALPDGNGIDVLRDVKADLPDLTVIMLTNHANALYRRACLRAGAQYFFDKSAEFDRLASVLSQLTKGDDAATC